MSLSAATHYHLRLCQTYWHTHENCMPAKQIIINFYICFCRTIFFLYNYLRQMYQIIHLSLEMCLSPARGKSVQKNSEVKRTSCNVVRLLCTHALEAIYRYIIQISRYFIIDFIVLYEHFYHRICMHISIIFQLNEIS